MKIITRYVVSELLRSFIYCQLFFTTLLLVVRFSEKEMGTFISKGMSFGKSIVSLMLQTPSYAVQMAPPSILFAMFFSIGRMAQFNEITAMKASGISLYRIFIPILVVALLITIGVIIFNDQVVTWATGKDIDIKSSNLYGSQSASEIVFMSSYNRSFYIKQISLKERTMNDVTIYDFNNENQIIAEQFARKVTWEDGVWHLTDGVTRILKDGSWKEERFKEKYIEVLEDPSIMVKASQDLSRLTVNDLLRLIGFKKRTGQTVRKELVAFHSRFSFPFSCFMMALIGAPLFARFGKSGVAVGFLLTMFITFVYWGIAVAIFEALGNNGKLPPIVSSWTANVLFAIVGVGLMIGVKK